MFHKICDVQLVQNKENVYRKSNSAIRNPVISVTCESLKKCTVYGRQEANLEQKNKVFTNLGQSNLPSKYLKIFYLKFLSTKMLFNCIKIYKNDINMKILCDCWAHFHGHFCLFFFKAHLYLLLCLNFVLSILFVLFYTGINMFYFWESAQPYHQS